MYCVKTLKLWILFNIIVIVTVKVGIYLPSHVDFEKTTLSEAGKSYEVL